MATIFRDILVAPLPASPRFVPYQATNLLVTTLATPFSPPDLPTPPARSPARYVPDPAPNLLVTTLFVAPRPFTPPDLPATPWRTYRPAVYDSPDLLAGPLGVTPTPFAAPDLPAANPRQSQRFVTYQQVDLLTTTLFAAPPPGTFAPTVFMTSDVQRNVVATGGVQRGVMGTGGVQRGVGMAGDAGADS